jgi:hypothetical protein
MLLELLKNNIHENIQLLRQLSNDEFCRKNPELSHATIGEHMRHIIELLNCLLDNYETNVVNYDLRKREISIQTDVNYAIAVLENQVQKIDKKNKSLALHHNCFSTTDAIETNYFREILYNLEHSTHHQALIKVALYNFPHIIISDSFGVAPSTLAYRNQCVQ